MFIVLKRKIVDNCYQFKNDHFRAVLELVMEKLGLYCPGLGTQGAAKMPSLTPSRPSQVDTMPIIDEDDFYDVS